MVATAQNKVVLSQYVPSLRRPRFNPFMAAFLLALGYFLFCSAYIWFSGLIAARFSESIADLQRIEAVKGILFIAVTTLGLFTILWFFLHRLHIDQEKLIRQQDELIKSERISTAGVFASSVAHDINNVVMVLVYYCDLFSKISLGTPELDRARDEAHAVLDELKELAGRLMRAGKGNLPSEFAVIDLAELVNNTISLIRKHEQLYKKNIKYKGPETLLFHANESALRQLLINLILNAGQAIPGKGEIEVCLNRVGQDVLIEIHDSGPGVEPDKRQEIFEAFRTTKQDGFGLGLTSVRVYVDMHRGTIKVDESNLGGACFRISLPVLESEATAG